jgi:nucleoid DNA-binding protein
VPTFGWHFGDLGAPWAASAAVRLREPSYTGAGVIAEVRAIHAAASAVIEARGNLTDALRENAKMQKDKAEFLRHLRDTLRTAYSHDQVTLSEFGLASVRTRGAPTGEELLLRVTKTQATRKERRTMGKRDGGRHHADREGGGERGVRGLLLHDLRGVLMGTCDHRGETRESLPLSRVRPRPRP